MKVTNIATRDHMRKLRAGEHHIDVGNGLEIGVSSRMIETFETLQVLVDDLILEHGVTKARKIITSTVEAAIIQWQKDQA